MANAAAQLLQGPVLALSHLQDHGGVWLAYRSARCGGHVPELLWQSPAPLHLPGHAQARLLSLPPRDLHPAPAERRRANPRRQARIHHEGQRSRWHSHCWDREHPECDV